MEGVLKNAFSTKYVLDVKITNYVKDKAGRECLNN